jgi:hypothetical protein
MCVRVRVALRRVEVLVPEALLYLAEDGAGAEELRGEEVAERVWSDMLSLADPAAST